MNSSRDESARARARLESKTPAAGDADLPKLEEQVAEVMRKSGQESPGAAFELRSVAQNYFGFVARKKAKAGRRVRDRTSKR